MLAHTEPYRLERALEVTWLTGACIAGPTAVLRRLGPFDPALHMFGEDVDLGLRAGAAGVRSRFDPTVCRIVHHGQGSIDRCVYGSREGWRPTGTLNWRAAVRRAYGPRRETAPGWRCGSTCACACWPSAPSAGQRRRSRRRRGRASARPAPELPRVNPPNRPYPVRHCGRRRGAGWSDGLSRSEVRLPGGARTSAASTHCYTK